MSAASKNVFVGITVLSALSILAWMILKFGDRPAKLFSNPQMPIHFSAERADGLGEGSTVQYLGVTVGRVERVRRAEDRVSVIIDAMVDQAPPLPANVEGIIYSQIIGGGSYISLRVTGLQPEGELKAGKEGPPSLTAHFRGVDLLPPEFADLAREMKLLAEQFRKSDVADHLDEQIEKVGKVLDSVQGIVGDEKFRKDIHEAVANFRTASESAKSVGQNLDRLTRNADTQLKELSGNANSLMTNSQKRIDDLARQAADRLQQVSKVLDNLDAASKKLNEGKGTMAELLNNPKLYESLLDTSRELNLTISDMRRVIDQWEQEGVPLKIK